MVSQNVKMEAPSPPNGNPEKPKGAGGRGRSPFAAPPQGEQGVIGPTHHALQNLKTQAGLPTAAGPSQKSSKSHQFSSFNFSTLFFMQNLQKPTKWTPKEIPLLKSAKTRAKMPTSQHQKKHI